MRHQELVYNLTGQTFYFDPPEGQPSGTPTVQVFSSDTDDDGTAESATTGSCSVDTVSTTLASAASVGDRSLTLTLGTGVTRGRRYLLAAANGEREWVEVVGISGAAVAIRQPLVNDYTTAATFKGCRISIGVNATWIADETNITDALEAASGGSGYRLRWSYTVDSVATIGVSYADVVRYQAKNLVTPLDVDARFPGWIDRLGPDYRDDQGESLVLEAFRAVKLDLLADDQAQRRIRDTEVMAELVKLRANLMSVEHQVMLGASGADALGLARDLYNQRYQQLIRSPKVAIDPAGGGAGAAGKFMPLWRR